MNAEQLLGRIADTLKRDIGPAIQAEYPRTQAFMAAVVLPKLARQMSLAPAHEAAQAADLLTLFTDLHGAIAAAPVPPAVAAAVAAVGAAADTGAVCALIEVLYAARAELGTERFEALLGRVRQTLRQGIDRRMEYAA